MPNDATRLIETNRERSTLPAHNSGGTVPSSSYFEIGGDGGEESYLIDLAQQKSPVYVYDLKTDELREAASDLQPFVKQGAASGETIRRNGHSRRARYRGVLEMKGYVSAPSTSNKRCS